MINPPTTSRLASPPDQRRRRWTVALSAAGATLFFASFLLADLHAALSVNATVVDDDDDRRYLLDDLSLNSVSGDDHSASMLNKESTAKDTPAAAAAGNVSARERVILAAFDRIEWSTTSRRYNATWEHHSRAFYTTDLAAIVDDYAEEAVLVVYNYATDGYAEFVGKAAIQRLYSGIFPRLHVGPDGTIFSGGFRFHERNTPRLRDNTVFSSWQSHTPAFTYTWATDTYIMRESDGKFIHQTVYYHGVETANATERRRVNEWGWGVLLLCMGVLLLCVGCASAYE